MNYLSISEWSALAATDPEQWKRRVVESMHQCIRNTGTKVVSRDLSDQATVGQGLLSGVPYGLKELFDFRGVPSHSSSIHPDLIAETAQVDSDVVRRFSELGGTCVAKAQMNEFAYGLSGENPHYGDCPHPHLNGRLTGGSSSGSAHLVAAGYVPMAIGTDTGGSIRVPAAWCGLYGIRWTPGYEIGGCFPLAPSFDTIGWFTRSYEDMKVTLSAWGGDEFLDSYRELKGSLLMPSTLIDPAVYTRLTDVVAQLELESSVSVGELEQWLPDCNRAFNVLQSREAFTIHSQRLKQYGDYYDPTVKARILRGTEWSDADIQFAEEMRAKVSDWFEAYFLDNDYLVMPVCPRPAVTVVQTTPELREKILRLTGPASLAQKPALTIPIAFGEMKESIGLQFIFKEPSCEVPLALLELCKNI